MTANVEKRIAEALVGMGRPLIALLALKAERKLFLVGGTVRDIIMGRPPTDFDFAVSGSGIEFAQKLARRLHASFVLLSEADDQARVVYHKELILDFNGFGERTIRDDLARRDFTINAIACEIEGGVQTQRPQRTRSLEPSQAQRTPRPDGLRTGELLDLFGGRKSIKEKRIRLVSDRALTSDPLRLLRAIRFALELGFEIEPEVFDQARLLSLAGTAAERIGYELLRIVNCDRSFPYIARLYELGLLHQILPEAKPLLDYKDVMQHSLGTYQKLEEMIHGASYFTRYEPEFKTYFGQDPQSAGLLKLVGLLHDIGKPETEFTNEKDEVHFYGHDALGGRYIRTIGLERLRLSRDRARAMKILVDQHMRLHLLATGPELTDRAIRRFLRNLGPHWFGLMMVTFADGFATAGHTLHLEEMFQRIIALKREYDAKIKVKRLVTGDDLIASGMTPGPAFKKILAELEELQVEGKIVSKEQGLEYVQTNLERLVAEGVEK